VKDLVTYQKAKKDFLLAWSTESYDNIIANLSSTGHFTYYEAKEHVLNLASNDQSPSSASSQTSKPQDKANAGSSLNRQKDKKKNTELSTSSNSGGKECNGCGMHSPDTVSGILWYHSTAVKV
jgi:hypothetical protein